MSRSLIHAMCWGMALGSVLGSAPMAYGQVVAFGGRFYGLTSTHGSWQQVEAEAVTRGGHLVSITTPGESDFIISTFLTALPPDARPLWIGLNDAAVEGQFAWSTGEPLAFANWFAGEPNDGAPNASEDYVAINWHRSLGLTPTPGAWNDVPVAGTVQGSAQTDGPYQGIYELPPLPADFDENGTVAGADFARWRLGFGAFIGAPHADGDANSDGDVDGGDFLAWQRELGRSRFAQAASVPEPTGGLLLAACALACLAGLPRAPLRRTFESRLTADVWYGA